MHPILFSIGQLNIYSYGLMLGIAFLVSVYLASRRAGIYMISPDTVNNLAIVCLVSGVIGARIAYAVVNISDFRDAPLRVFMINEGGLIFYGGFTLAFIAGIAFARITALSVRDTADLMVPFVALGHAIGRIGCFLNGCCYGRPTDSLLGVQFPHMPTKVYPTQLFSSGGLFIIFCFLFFMQKRRRFKGEITSLYLIIYGIFRFFMEFLRGDLFPVFHGFTVTQIVSIAFIATGTALFAFKGFSREKLI